MKIQKVSFALVGALALVSTSVIPASATTFGVSADRSTNLVAAGDSVTVTLTGVPADQGLYVRLCKGTLAEVSQARPAQCFGQGAWVSLSSVQQGFGAGNAEAPVVLAVKAQFDSVDCQVDACGIHVRRDHNGGSADYSLDRFIPVTFNSPLASNPAPAARNGVVRSGGKVTFTIVNKKGKTVVVWIGSKKFVKKVVSNTFTISLPAKAKGTLYASAYVNGARVIAKKFN